jgi:hypothetical protein
VVQFLGISIISSEERALLNGQVEKVLQKATTDFDDLIADLQRLANTRSKVSHV